MAELPERRCRRHLRRDVYYPSMPSFAALHDQTNHVGSDFVFIELETGGTFLDVAETTKVEETRLRNRENAHTAYKSALRYRERVIMDEVQQLRFDALSSQLRARLLALGFAV